MKEVSPYFISRNGDHDDDPAPPWVDGRQPEGEELKFLAWWRAARKRWLLIAAVLVATIVFTAFRVFTETPVFTAKCTVMIERKSPQVVNIESALADLLNGDNEEGGFYKTQYEVLHSRRLAAKIVRDQGLEHNPLFVGRKRSIGLVANLIGETRASIARLISRLMPAPPGEKSNPVDVTQDPLGVDPGIVDAYMVGLSIRPIDGTKLVDIYFSSPDPNLAARLANAHAVGYGRYGLELSSRANEESQRFLEEKLVELKEKVEKSEIALNSYSRSKGIVSLSDKENVVVERLADVNKELTGAEQERIGLEAQIKLIKARSYDSLPAVANSALIQGMKGQLDQLEAEYVTLANHYKPGFPKLLELKAKLDETRSRLKQEIAGVIASTESAYLAAQGKEEQLRKAMEDQKATAMSLKDAGVQYAILAREADTNRQLYDSVLQRMKEIGVTASVHSSNVSITDDAEPPRIASSPKKMQSLMYSAVFGLIGAIALAVFLETMDNTLKTPEDVKRHFGLASLSVVPDFTLPNRDGYSYGRKQVTSSSERPNHRLGKELIVSHSQFAPTTEAYRKLRTAILLSRAGEPPRSVLFTSATNSEGKTVTAVNASIAFAQTGARVLLIDADLRRPRCHKILAIEKIPGLTEVLTGQLDAGAAVRTSPVDGLFVLCAGTNPPNPTELLGSVRMQQVLGELCKQYDYLIIDSAPILPVSDSVVLSKFVDGVVLVVSGARTPRSLVKDAYSSLSDVRANVLGVMLNRVDIMSPDYHYYRTYYSYSQKPDA
jgi:capsular exopolysaccharide synthesis family protein